MNLSRWHAANRMTSAPHLVLAEIILRIDHRALPLTNVGFAMRIERLRQRLQ